MDCEKYNGVEAYYMVAPDENSKTEVLQALNQHDLMGRTMFFKLDQATLTVALSNLFEQLQKIKVYEQQSSYEQIKVLLNEMPTLVK